MNRNHALERITRMLRQGKEIWFVTEPTQYSELAERVDSYLYQVGLCYDRRGFGLFTLDTKDGGGSIRILSHGSAVTGLQADSIFVDDSVEVPDHFKAHIKSGGSLHV